MTKPPKASVEELAQGLADMDDGGGDFQDQISVAEAMTPAGEVLDAEAQAERDVENMDALEGLRQMRDAIGIRWRVYRVDADDSRKIGFLAEWNTSQLSQKRIANKFGAGKYRVMGTYSSGKFAAQRTIEIAEGVDRDEGSEVTAQSGSSQTSLTELMSAFEMRQAAERREAEAREDKRRRERLEFWQTFGPMVATMLAPVLAALVSNKGPDMAALINAVKGPDPLTQLKLLKEMSGDKGPSSIDQVMSLLERVQDMAPKGEGSRGMLDSLIEGAKALMPAIQQSMAQAASRPAPAAALPPPQQPVPVELSALGPLVVGDAPAIPETSPMFKLVPWLGWFKGQIEVLLLKASQQRDPALRADAFIDDIPDNFPIADLMPILKSSDWFAQLCQLDPRIQNYQAWFTEFHRVLVEQLEAMQKQAG